MTWYAYTFRCKHISRDRMKQLIPHSPQSKQFGSLCKYQAKQSELENIDEGMLQYELQDNK